MSKLSLVCVLAGALVLAAGDGAAAPTKKKPAAPLRFHVAAGEVSQELEVRPSGKRTISFKLVIGGKCQRTMAGQARAASGDTESDEDDQGVAYVVNEYRYTGKDGCYLAIRVDAEARKRARVQAADCESPCPTLTRPMARVQK